MRACRCRAAVEAAWGVVRERWAALHPLNAARRHEALALLQPLAELQVRVSCSIAEAVTP